MRKENGLSILTQSLKPHIILIDTDHDANSVINMILADQGCVVGVDIEAAVEMSRFGILCLLQVKFN